MARDKMTIQDLRYAIVVVGMHRSGTSATAGVLARLGCDVPKDLMEAQPMNAKGFYESNKISYMNDDLLKSAGSTWFAWQEFNTSWFRSPKAAEFRDRALATLKEVYGTSRMPVLKDPRMCLLVPFWDEILTEAGYVPKYLHTHRHPLEVAMSLDHWAGYDPNYGQLLWLRYILESEAATRGKSRHFSSYNQVMQDWPGFAARAAEALDLAWPASSVRVSAEIDDFLDGELQHMTARGTRVRGGAQLIPWVAEAYAILERWAEEGEDSDDYETLDALLAQFNQATPAFSALVESGRRDVLALRVKAQEDQKLQGQIEALSTAADLARGERDALGAELTAAQGSRDALGADLTAAQDARDALGAELTAAQDARDALIADLTAAQGARDALGAELTAAQGELDQSLAQLAELEAEVGTLRHHRARLESELAQRSLEAEEVGADLARARDALAGAREQGLGLAAEKAALHQELAARRAELDALRAELQQAHDAATRFAAERETLLREMRNRKVQIEQEARARFTAALRDQRERFDATRAQAEAALAEARAQIAQVRHDRDQTAQRKLEAEFQIAEMLHSSSWRMTAPMRRLAMACRRLLRRG